MIFQMEQQVLVMVTQKLKIESGALCRFRADEDDSVWRYILTLKDYNAETELITLLASGRIINDVLIATLIELGDFEVIQCL